MPATLPQDRSSLVATLGIVGGGQLAKMTAQAASTLAVEVHILERSADFPARGLAQHSLQGDWNDAAELLRLASGCDVITLENEFVDADALEALERSGQRLFPSAHTIRTVQDKFTQKTEFARAGLPVPAFAAVNSPAELEALGQSLGWPMVLKKRRNGYDGKGNATVRSASEVERAWRELQGTQHALYAEAFCPFVRELAIMVVRGRDGEIAAYPVVETVQKEHICHWVYAPAPIPQVIAQEVERLARQAVAAIDGVGCFGLELFLLADGSLRINEIAPRVHNSGHYSIEACATSQFENHVRAVLGWPLGSTAMRAPAAVMVNLLGQGPGRGAPQGLAAALAVPGAHVHLYGKRESARGRKLGHITALGATLAQAQAIAQAASAGLRFGTPQ